MDICTAYANSNALLVFNRLAFAVLLLKCGGSTVGPLAMVAFLSFVPAFSTVQCHDDGVSVTVAAPRRTHGLLIYEMLYKRPWLLWPSLLWASKTSVHRASLAYGSFVLSQRVRITGDLHRPVPEYAFITCHHRMKLEVNRSLDLYSSFLLANNFDEVHIAIGFGGFGVFRPLMTIMFGTIDLVRAKDPHWALVQPIVAARAAGRTCAVVVFPDRDGMQYWGDRTMCSRNGVYAAALACDVPILDIVAMEPTPVAPESLFHIRHIDCARPRVSALGPSYKDWRDANTLAVQTFKNAVHSQYLKTVDSLESARGSCSLKDQLSTCDLSLEATINQSIARTLRATRFDQSQSND